MTTPAMLSAGAVISSCGRYRYSLSRTWRRDGLLPVLWVMLNPSTADAMTDDPTIRRCIGFTESWGRGSIVVGNVFSFRATDPKELLKPPLVDLQGPDHFAHLWGMASKAAFTVVAWGACARVSFVDMHRLSQNFKSPGGVFCLGKTKHGAPRHPLYLAADTKREEWRP